MIHNLVLAVLLTWLAIQALGTIGLVGKPRKTITPEMAMWTVTGYAVLICTVLFVASS